MKRIVTLGLFALSTLAFAADTASAAPTGLNPRPVDLELREADVGNLFRLLADVGQANVVLDPCVKGKVDLKLKNVPVPIVFDALATQLGLHYETRQGTIFVACGKSAPGDGATSKPPADPRLERRLSLQVRDADLGAILAQVSKGSGLEVGTTPEGTKKLSLALENARVSTILAALSDATGLDVALEDGKLVAKPREPAGKPETETKP